MDLVKRFLKYVSFDTQSDENSNTTPSTLKQLELGKYLVKELKSIGLNDAFLDEYGIVYASIKSNCNEKCDTIGLIAHMDTSPDCSGSNIKPRIINNYDGKDVVLNENVVMRVDEFECLKDVVGQDLIVTDGTTLLGADDKAGIAIIVECCYRILNSNIKHGDIKIAFTPDEEVGRGTENFDVEFFNCDYAYTLDGGDIRAIAFENFNAASVKVCIDGISIHPGSAKNKMVNSLLVAHEFDSLLPENELPENTEIYEGFHHLISLSGEVEKTTATYILRNHDASILNRQKNDFIKAAEVINNKYKYECVKCEIKDSYRNMKEIIDKNPKCLNKVIEAYKENNYDYFFEPIRGGTDGASLSFKGLPCPNLGNGGYNFHGRYEFVSITQMRQAVNIVLSIIKVK